MIPKLFIHQKKNYDIKLKKIPGRVQSDRAQKFKMSNSNHLKNQVKLV